LTSVITWCRCTVTEERARWAQVAQPFRGVLGPRLLAEDEQPIEHCDDEHRDASWSRPAMNARRTAAENSSATR